MPKFCDKCGHELKNENVKFCDKCGAELIGQSKLSNTYNNMIYQEDHKTTVILGYVCTVPLSLLFPLIGLIVGVIFAVYLFTRDNNDDLKIHGIIMILIPIVVFMISLLILSSLTY